MTVRAKMQVTSIDERDYGNVKVKFLNMACLYDHNSEEDKRFCKATPSGTLSFQIDNPAALEQFKQGDSFYVDFTKIENVPQGQ